MGVSIVLVKLSYLTYKVLLEVGQNFFYFYAHISFYPSSLSICLVHKPLVLNMNSEHIHTHTLCQIG